MGVGVSDWRLARAVSMRDQIGVVSGTALDGVLSRRLQLGDPGGHMRRALAALPDQGISTRLIERYFIEGGKPFEKSYVGKPLAGDKFNKHLEELLIAANFTEVFLAKEGHSGMVGINFLNKIQAPLLPSLYGAILAGVDIVIVGAGIPLEIPKIIDSLCKSEIADLKLEAKGVESGSTYRLSFDPGKVLDNPPSSLHRPLFFPVVSSTTLATLMVKKCKDGQVNGLIIEESTAGGHNAPPRGKTQLSPEGEPIYGARDVVDLSAIKSLGLPFWMAGSYGSPEKLQSACAAGAEGVQIGTLFAFCEESGLRDDIKRDVVENCHHGTPHVFTDPAASPTGFPFKVLSVSGTLSDPDLYAARHRRCDLGYLREAYERPDGALGWRCPAEESEAYVKKGGVLEDSVGKKCICNGLMANIGLAQINSDSGEELPLLTCGEDLSGIRQVLGSDEASYTASEVIDFLLTSKGT